MKVTLSLGTPSVKTYGIAGKTPEKLLEAMKKRKWWGHYESKIKYSGKVKNGKVTEIKISASPAIDMPKWSDYGKQDAAAKKVWDEMWKALKKHEETHHEVTKTEAEKFKKTLEGGSDLTAAEMKKAWGDFDKELGKAQKAYDDKTDHGAKEGVNLFF